MEDYPERIRQELTEIIGIFKLTSEVIPNNLAGMVDICREKINKGGRLFFLGNGGSAADAQHLACECVVRYKKNRRPIPAYALTVNTSILTAAGNDYGFDQIFSRQVQSDCHPGDVLLVFSTSGTSTNVLKAVEAAKEKGVTVLAFTGKNGQLLADKSDSAIMVPDESTPRIQEVHITLGHIFCGLLEEALELEPGAC